MENPVVRRRCWISYLNDDLLHNIFTKLPAHSFASAACVSRSWNDVCSRLLSRPLLSSAISLNSSLTEGIEEVVRKVLSGPIQPHFAILCVSPRFDLDEAHRLITENLGSKTPLITCDAGGIIGRDAMTDQFSEVMFPFCDEEDDDGDDHADSKGISLTVGYVPGLKVDVIPVERYSAEKFVTDIRDYSASAPCCTSPEAIFIFGDSRCDIKPILEKLDYAMSEKTIIAGNESCRFRWTSIDNSTFNYACRHKQGHFYSAVGLVFASDQNAPNGACKINFHFAVGNGVTPVGQTYRVVSAKSRGRELTTWLTAQREGENETLDGDQILEDLNNINMEMGNHSIRSYDLYIGVTKRRNYSIGTEKVKAMTSLSYHSVQQGDEEYMYVGGLGIKTGDSFRFCVPHPTFASNKCDAVSEDIRRIRHKQVIGSFVFSCCGRGSMFFGKPNVDSAPVLDNFPDIPISGLFCGAEVGRGPPLSSISGPEEDRESIRSCFHVYSSIYVLMSCSQPSPKP